MLFSFLYQVILFIFILFNILPAVGYARWPMFSPPNKVFLVSNNLIDTHDCPPGEGKLALKEPLQIQEPFCRGFCPGTWAWVGSSDGQCHDIERDFNFQYYDIKHFSKSSDTTLYSIVTAHYSHPALTFVMETERDNHWYCYEMNTTLHLISCANDT